MSTTMMANREVALLTIADIETGKPLLRLDYANAAAVELDGKSVVAYGGYGRAPRVIMTGGRTGVLTVETQITPFELFRLLADDGGEVRGGAFMREELTAVSNKLTLSRAPVAGTLFVFPLSDDCGTAVSCAVSGKAVTLTGTTETEFAAYYSTDDVTGIESAAFLPSYSPKAVAVHGETQYRGSDGETIDMRFTAASAVLRPTTSLAWSNSGDAASVKLTFDLAEDESGDFFTLRKVG